MKKLWRRLADAIPVYAVLPLIFCFTVNCIVYWGTGLIAGPLKHYDFTLAFDEMVPLVPGIRPGQSVPIHFSFVCRLR